MVKNKSLEKKTRDFHRLRYDEMQILQEKFQRDNLTCGFMREPEYNPTTNQVKGFCYFMEQQGVTTQCKKYVPFKAEGCKYYERWREKNEMA